MGWGHIGLSWTRYAKSIPVKTCGRCHLDFPEAEDSCPHCSQIGDYELESYLRELEVKKKKSTHFFMLFIAALALYAVIVLFILPMFLH